VTSGDFFRLAARKGDQKEAVTIPGLPLLVSLNPFHFDQL